MAQIVSLNRSPGGVPKLPVSEAAVTFAGLEGDRQRNLRVHGGPTRALCLFSMELIEDLQKQGHPIFPGAIGENITIRGLDWPSIQPGTRLRLGNDVEISITKFTQPCRNIRGSFADGDYRRVDEEVCQGRSRVYARVLKEGTLRVGDEVVVTRRPDDVE
jgi:MOSC domain-containing protein YiiM